MKRNTLQQYIGNQSQIGGTRHYVLTDGWGRNLRAIDINSGSGLRYTVLPDRGMDISHASFKGINLVYLTCNAETHPAFYEPENIGWLRTFAGGLVTTCGLTWLSGPVNDNGEALGLHGRYSTIPAKQVADLSQWIGDDYHIKVKGVVEEGYMFGNKLRLEREISTIAGQNSLRITDTVTNFGFNDSPFTILYHMNIGYPLLSEDTELIFDPEKTLPKDEFAAAGIKEFRRFSKPQAGFREQVFNHLLKPAADGYATVILENKKIGISFTLKINALSQPYLIQWKMMGQGEYVLGLEPSNIPLKDRKTLKEEKILPLLMPGESVTNNIEVILGDISRIP
jgi:hypothetical protein